jgi:hypothetical protein
MDRQYYPTSHNVALGSRLTRGDTEHKEVKNAASSAVTAESYFSSIVLVGLLMSHGLPKTQTQI